MVQGSGCARNKGWPPTAPLYGRTGSAAQRRACVQTLATLLALQLGIRLLHRALRQQPRKQHAASAHTLLIDLPAAVLGSIITLADKESRLALFRQTHLSMQADAKLVEQNGPAPQVGTSSQLDGVMQPGLVAGSAIKLLWLASRSAHDVNLHICSSFTLQQALERIKLTWTTGSNSNGVSSCGGGNKGNPSSNNMSNGSNGGRGGTHDDNWLSDVMDPFLHTATPVMPLQNVTTLWLQDMVLDHPMPQCVGQVCTGLKSYGLHNVTWPSTAEIRCWPQVQQLTLQDVYDPDMSLVFNPKALPELRSLKLAWPDAFHQPLGTVKKAAAWELGCVINNFSQQLMTLNIEGFTWPQVMCGTLGTICTEVVDFSISNQVDKDFWLTLMTQSIPKMQSLCIGALGLTKSFRHAGDCKWEKLQHLKIDSLVGDTMSVLACLPQMPQLHLVTLPSSITPSEVVVGPDWLADVAKVLGKQPSSSGSV